MHAITEKWVQGWKIIGRLFVSWVIFQLLAALLLPAYVIIDNQALANIVAAAGFVVFGPLAVYVAASAAKICPDVTETRDTEPSRSANRDPVS